MEDGIQLESTSSGKDPRRFSRWRTRLLVKIDEGHFRLWRGTFLLHEVPPGLPGLKMRLVRPPIISGLTPTIEEYLAESLNTDPWEEVWRLHDLAAIVWTKSDHRGMLEMHSRITNGMRVPSWVMINLWNLVGPCWKIWPLLDDPEEIWIHTSSCVMGRAWRRKWRPLLRSKDGRRTRSHRACHFVWHEK
jgi:hypothetical protein